MTVNDFAAAWDARDRLIEELTQKRCLPGRTLYIRRNNGGTLSFGLLPDHGGLIVIDWQNESCQTAILRRPALRLEPYEQKAEGFGGIFGFGEKGAWGWSIHLLDGDAAQAEAGVLPNITSVADFMLTDDPFLTGKRKPRIAPLGQLRPEDRETCERILTLWERLVLESGQ